MSLPSREATRELVTAFLNELEIPYVYLEEFDTLATIDRYGHQVTLKVYDTEPLDEGAPPDQLLQVQTVLLADVEVANPIEWYKLALANTQAPFVKFSANEGNQILVSVDLFTWDLTPSIIVRALLAITKTASEQGDVMAEYFGGTRVYSKRGRLRGG